MSNFKIIPDGNLINFDTVKKIQVEGKKMYILYLSGFRDEYELNDEWRELLKNLAKGDD